MNFDGTESEYEGYAADEDEFGRPVGARPVGARPVGARPVGARPVGARPVGARPVGARPVGARPVGARPVGARPVGARPVGARPVGARGGVLDSDEWSADVFELVCAHSAVIRLGATIVSDEYELHVPALDGPPPWLPREERLRPRDFQLQQIVNVPNRLARDIAANPELAFALKLDLATALAAQADAIFLQGAGGALPAGITVRVPVTGAVPFPVPPAPPVGVDLLATARAMLSTVRAVFGAFRNPGWVLSLNRLDVLTQLLTADGLALPQPGPGPPPVTRSLDSSRLLTLNGADGGMLLGFPFVTSAGALAPAQIYFAADWQEAWIAIDRDFVTVDISTDAAFAADQTAIRASMSGDFTLRQPGAFTWTNA